jgi:four helix bundle protein
MRKIDEYQINILERTKKFAVGVIKISSVFPKNPAGFTISDQLVRAGTSIGANLIEAQEAVSPKDFFYKITISLKEAKETKYWLELISLSNLLSGKEIKPLLQEVEEIVKILIATLKKLREKK